jgi:hypothetical protein
MSDLVKKLVNRAWAESELITETRTIDEAFTNKFAELIVKDVAQFCYNNNELRVEQAYNLRKQIFSHYGIEQ